MRMIQVVLVVFFAFACTDSGKKNALVQNDLVLRDLKSYQASFSSKLIDRVQTPPGHVMEYLNELDQTKYVAYQPDHKDKLIIQRVLNQLPPVIKRVLQKRLIAIYFVHDFATNGLMDFVHDDQNELYGFLVIRKNVLDMDISELLTQKEATAFIQDDSGYTVQLQMSKKASALHYILLHEAVHLLDLVERISPWLEPQVKDRQLLHTRSEQSPLVDLIWKDYRLPRPAFDFSLRNQVTYYGFGNGPRLYQAQIPALYEQLEATPFVSAYAATIWVEDIAELFTFYALKKYQNMDLHVQISKNGHSIKQYYPLGFREVQKRLRLVKKII